MRPAHRALSAVTAAVVGYNIAAPAGETISEGVDELLGTHPLLTRGAIALLAMHVANVLVAQADPIHWAFGIARHRRMIVSVESQPTG